MRFSLEEEKEFAVVMAVAASGFMGKSAISLHLDYSSFPVKFSCLKVPLSSLKPLVVLSVALSPPARTVEPPPVGYRKNVGICLVSPCRKIFTASKIHVPDRWQMPQIMRQRRIDRGALTIASAEVKIQIDTETHDPLDIGMYQIREPNQMVEEFMLAANVSVAGQILKQFPSCSLLRRHPTPTREMLEPRAQRRKTVIMNVIDAERSLNREQNYTSIWLIAVMRQ